MHGHHGGGGLMMLPLMLAMLVVLAAVVGLAVHRIPALRQLLRGVASSPTPALPQPLSPLEILDRRLAEGTIEVSDYRARVAELRRIDDEQPPCLPQVPFA